MEVSTALWALWLGKDFTLTFYIKSNYLIYHKINELSLLFCGAFYAMKCSACSQICDTGRHVFL